jgi:hypothetical protein
MALIASCPHCASPLGIPAEAVQDAHVQCPHCEHEFSLSSLAPRELLEARIVPSVLRENGEAEFLEEQEIEISQEDELLNTPPDSAHAAAVPSELKTTPRRPRRSAGLGSLVGIVGGGAVGLFLGAYALLWIRGPEGDIAGLAKWLPPVLLPESVQNAADFDSAN